MAEFTKEEQRGIDKFWGLHTERSYSEHTTTYSVVGCSPEGAWVLRRGIDTLERAILAADTEQKKANNTGLREWYWVIGRGYFLYTTGGE